MNRVNLSVILLAALCTFGALDAWATDSQGSSTSVIPSSGDEVKAGDIIYFRSDAPIFTRSVEYNGGAGTTTVYCAPANSRFEVQSITPATTTPATGNVTDTPDAAILNPQAPAASQKKAVPADTKIVVGTFPLHRGLHRKAVPDRTHSTSKCFAAPANAVDMGVPYQFTTDKLDKVSTQRMGFTWGAMVIPYKFYFTDRTFKSNPSTVAFAGYEGYLPGISIAGVAAVGPGLSSNSQNATTSTTTGSTTPNNTTNTTSNTASTVTYTGAAGLIVTFGGTIKGGILFGRDWQGHNSGFKYENKTWMALSIGTSF